MGHLMSLEQITMNLYRNESPDPKRNAQMNLMGRTHYVDDASLRWHHSRVLSARTVDGGLLFAITESVGLDMNNSKRGFRYAIFDLFGTILERPDLEHCFKSDKAATKAMWSALNALDAKAVTLAAIEKATADHAREMEYLRGQVAKIETSPKSTS